MQPIIHVPRLMDDTNCNAQNKNAQALLSRWRSDKARIHTNCYFDPSPGVVENSRVVVHKLWRRHLWPIDVFRQYMRRYSLILYPGGNGAEWRALRWRRRLLFSAPVVATLEGLMGNELHETEYSNWAGHPVYCQRAPARALARWQEIFQEAACIIAISPFLARMGRKRYGDKFAVLPLGIDTSVFYGKTTFPTTTPRVVSAGRVDAHKRPAFMLELAMRFPDAEFVWFGDGAQREQLMVQITEKQLKNVRFPGPRSPTQLADEFRQSDIFVMPSRAEGVPKVTQEAAACGLAQVIFGFYEAPSVVDGQNGFVVWSDEQFIDRVGALLNDRALASNMGKQGAVMAREKWNWDLVAQKWEETICQLL